MNPLHTCGIKFGWKNREKAVERKNVYIEAGSQLIHGSIYYNGGSR
jgi:hypothetical protein